MVKLVTVAFNTNHMNEMVQLYTALGATLEEKKVKNGGLSYQGMLGQLNLTIYGISKGSGAGSPNFSMKIEVDQLSRVMEIISKIDREGHSIELVEPWKAN